jgi:hypothetical protein
MRSRSWAGCTIDTRGYSFRKRQVLWDGKNAHRECYFPQFPTALAVRTSRIQDLPLRIGIAIIPPPRPAFVGGKGSPCEGSLCEEES